MTVDWIELSFVGTAFLLFVAIVFLWRTRDQITLFKKWFNKPIEYLPNVQNVKEFESVMKILPQLTINERELLIQQCFGRPIRLVKGIDKDGRSWIEAVTYFSPEEGGDTNFHFSEMKVDDNKVFG